MKTTETKRYATEARIEEPDLFYDALLKKHEALNRDASEAFNARLIFLLANQIGSQDVLIQCLEAASADL